MEKRENAISEEFLLENFPELWKYIEPKNVTDLDFNCGNLWISKTDEITQLVDDPVINEKYMRNVANSIAIRTGTEFNPKKNRMFVATETLRVTCVYPTVSNGRISVCLRKELAEVRFTKKEAISNGFCEPDTYNLLQNCVLAKKNMTWCGMPAAGKTEGVKKFSSYIFPYEKVITIEDTPELHFAQINPGHNCIELKTGTEGYQQCINDALRMNPAWMLFGEAIGGNTKYLLEVWSNGVATMNTLHVGDIRDIPDKIVNSSGLHEDSERITEQVYKNLGMAVLVKKKMVDKKKIKRYIDQVCFYYRKGEENGLALFVKNGVLRPECIPDFIRKEIEEEIERDIFSEIDNKEV